MTSHVKKENKLPGCFDQEFFDPLGKNAYCGAQVIFDSGCLGDGVPGTPDKEVMDNQASMESPPLENQTPVAGIGEAKFTNGKLIPMTVEEKPGANSTARKKRKRPSVDASNEEMDDFKSQLYSMLETSSRVLTAHVESQNVNCELDRNQRKEHAESLVGVLGKLADALGRIAEKL